MGKYQVWSVTAYVFLFLSLASQIHCRSHSNGIRGGVNQQEAKEKDLIKRFPGQPPVSFKQYGGFVPVNETTGRFFYYYFVEAIKASDSAPLVLWLNGGPACSSLGLGALMEHGPFRVHSDGKTLFRNPYAFNNEANVLYLESPAGTGFSYTNTADDMTDPTDSMTAEDNYMFLVKWLERFPEYKGREFYMAGQSYAGHYIPQLAELILQRNKQTFINLRGLLLGNPSLNPLVESDSVNPFLVSHAIIPPKYLDDYVKCVKAPVFDFEFCSVATSQIEAQVKRVDTYNILAPLCKNATLTRKPKKGTTVMVYDPCNKHYVAAYLNRKEVQKAIHVKSTKTQYVLWQQCNHTLSSYWSQDDTNLISVPLLHEIMGQGVRIFVYSGDLDSAIPVTGTMETIKSMNLTVEKSWRQWFSGGEVGGFTEEYRGNFTFATARAAGHSVPLDQPIRALTIFTSFVRNTRLPSTF